MSNITLSATAPTSLFDFSITIKNQADDLVQDFANTTAATDFTVVSSNQQTSSVEVFSVSNVGTGLRALKVHPEMTPGSTYTVTAQSHTGENSASFTVPISLISAETTHPKFPTPPLETLSLAFGQEFQKLIGVPESIVIANFNPETETTIFCESSYGFPEKGSFFVDTQRFDYTSKFDGGFKGVTRSVSVGIPNDFEGTIAPMKVGEGSLLVFDIFSHGVED